MENQVKPWELWINRWDAALKACRNLGGGSEGVLVKPPATLEQIEDAENKLGVKLPPSFRTAMLEFSAGVEFSWRLPDDEDVSIPLPQDFRGIFGSDCSWNLFELVEIDDNRKSWVQNVFPDPTDPYDCVWHNKLAFKDISNGDFLAFDLENGPDYSVVYLSHDDGEGHGYRLGNNFIDFMNRWTRIGCPGSEDWQMIPFVTSSNSGIEPDGEKAKKWREWFGLLID
ncbi:SMI1/KNR4 family protein [Brevibacillus sp. SYSU BS000544]|uniref:SMI1/KNR4 family protein n=1 Tax=Brevibacillus sp. SYSU BS000544 TaxID=3416443 RepID=UPI003CE47E1B